MGHSKVSSKSTLQGCTWHRGICSPQTCGPGIIRCCWAAPCCRLVQRAVKTSYTYDRQVHYTQQLPPVSAAVFLVCYCRCQWVCIHGLHGNLCTPRALLGFSKGVGPILTHVPVTVTASRQQATPSGTNQVSPAAAEVDKLVLLPRAQLALGADGDRGATSSSLARQQQWQHQAETSQRKRRDTQQRVKRGRAQHCTE